MVNKETGGPAFPGVDEQGEPYTGMTLRDYFAAKAMQGLCTGYSHDKTWPNTDEPEEYEVVALHAYMMADAMLKAREA